MDDWHDFFATAAQTAAALAGLLFVGVSINLDKFMANPRYGLAGRALDALVLLVAVLLVKSLLLGPAQRKMVAGVEVLVVGITDLAAIAAIQLLQLRH